MNKITQIDSPLNAQEKYLHGINLRLEVLIDQVSSLVEHISKKDNVAVESGKVEVKVEPDVQPQVEQRANTRPVTRNKRGG